MSVRLATPRLSVVLAEGDDEAIVVQVINADMVLAEVTGRKHNWGKFTDSAIQYQTFMAWAALKRRGLIPGDLLYEKFAGECASIESIDVNAKGLPTAAGDYSTPTLPDPVSG